MVDGLKKNVRAVSSDSDLSEMDGKFSSQNEVSSMLAAASAEANLDDFGDMGFVAPLREFLRQLPLHDGLSDDGVAGLKAGVANQLVNRLRLTRDLKVHPEILEEDVSDPIVILGLPRTGSTKLQRMMSADPTNQALLYWKLLNPAPFPDTKPGVPDPRIAVGKAACEAMNKMYPEMLKTHPTFYDQADEDYYLTAASYEHFGCNVTMCNQDYCDYIAARPATNSYNYLKVMLQYLQWQGAGKRGPWVLKAPTHLGNLEPIVEVFPRATIIHTHRDPTMVMPSECRLIQASPLMKKTYDPHQIGREQLRIWKAQFDRHYTGRKKLGSRLNILDIQYQQIEQDPFIVIAEIYARAGKSITLEGRVAMEKWADENRKDRFGKNIYTMEYYGLDKAAVEAAFAPPTA